MKLTKGAVSVFLYEVNHLVDNEYKESIENIHEQMKNGDIIGYLANKYKNEIDLSLLNGQDWGHQLNQIFTDMSNVFAGNERRKWGIEKNGLCLLVSWAAEIIRDFEVFTKE